MKIAILAAVVLLVATAPVAVAGHAWGPCWHEYIENPKEIRQTARSCLLRDGGPVFDLNEATLLA